MTQSCSDALCVRVFVFSAVNPLLCLIEVLHPCFKGKYFAIAKWPDLWVADAYKELRALWKDHYKPTDFVEASADMAQRADDV